jgi:L-ascorbate metabolism protein UlaG (beta-lactamase superfamily)
VLATHSHKDHFSADMVSRLLRASPKAVFVGPDDAAGALVGFGDRVRALRVGEGERKAIDVNGIRVEAVYLSHGTPIMNLGYLVTVGHRRFFHTGDIAMPAASPAYMRGLGLLTARIDYGLIPHFLLASADTVAYVREVIAPRVIIAAHLQYTDPPDEPGIRAHCPDAVILKPEMSSWAIK